jgi:hypothetical protein
MLYAAGLKEEDMNKPQVRAKQIEAIMMMMYMIA